jgi:xanthine dehydrogenase accessory factor
MTVRVLVRGGGDLASGVIIRLHRSGFFVWVTEIGQPLAVRRTVSFSSAVLHGKIDVEDVHAERVDNFMNILTVHDHGNVPVIVDAGAESRFHLQPDVLVDARMTKKEPDLGKEAASLVIGLGPGFTAGVNCHAVVETIRGPFLGRVIWNGCADPDTGLPEAVGSHREDRVLRAPTDGILHRLVDIGSIVQVDQPIAEVNGIFVKAPFQGLVRGILQDGIFVTNSMKIGDLDPRLEPRLCQMVSDKALAIGGGVLESILSKIEFRRKLGEP